MHDLYELKEMLLKELEEYGSKGELSAGTLDIVDKLSHTVKNLCKIIDAYEDDDGYSGNMPYRRSYRTRRDSRGRYSNGYARDEGMVAELRSLMQDAPDERTRQEFQRFISKIESM